MKMFKESRRGSTIVMVAIMLVAFLGVGAIGSDIGRFYVVAGELQTAADAAALKGALQLQGTQGNSPGFIVDTAVMHFVSSTNWANGIPLSVTQDNVQIAYYTPRDSQPPNTITPASIVTPPPGALRPNAVIVTLTSAPTGIFSQLLGRAGAIDLTRKATAWIANVNSNCVRGMALPYRSLYNQVSPVDVLSPNAVPNLDPSDFQLYEQQLPTNRMFVLVGPNASIGSLTPQQAAYTDGSWRGVEYHGNNGKNAFIDNIAGCTRTGLDASNVKALSGAQVEDWTDDGLRTIVSPNTQPVCFSKSNDAGCYPSASSNTPGVVINVDWTDDPDANGAFGPSYRYVGKFTLICYNDNPAAEPCNASKIGAPKVYPAGTIVGFMNSLSSTTITPNDVLSNTVGNVQRLILVK